MQYSLDFNYVEKDYRDVVGFEGLYRVNNYGEVFSLRSKKNLRPDTDKDGYKIFTLTKGKSQKKFKAHRLVYHTFFPDADRTLQINHINKIKDDNRLWNLEPVNIWENNSHKFSDKKTSSKYRGVTRAVRDCAWIAQIQINKRKKHIGSFKCETAAYIAYLKELKSQNLTNKYA